MSCQTLLSFDIEEFDIPTEYGTKIPLSSQLSISSAGLDRLLCMLDRLSISATCFMTARYASEIPEDAARIAAHHEVASHGVNHTGLEPGDLARSRKMLQESTGAEVLGFRSPRFAPLDEVELRDAGYTYNSSTNPIYLPGRYNRRHLARTTQASCAAPGLTNIPISCSPRLRVPMFWLAFHHMPMTILRDTARRCLDHDGVVVLVFHPWEFVDISRFGLPWYITRRSGEGMMRRLESFLEWLSNRTTFMTMGAFAKSFSRQNVHTNAMTQRGIL